VRKFRELGESEAAWSGYIDTTLFLLAEAASVHQDRTTSTNIDYPADSVNLPI
jgi:hypothetical protein